MKRDFMPNHPESLLGQKQGEGASLQAKAAHGPQCSESVKATDEMDLPPQTMTSRGGIRCAFDKLECIALDGRRYGDQGRELIGEVGEAS